MPSKPAVPAVPSRAEAGEVSLTLAGDTAVLEVLILGSLGRTVSDVEAPLRAGWSKIVKMLAARREATIVLFEYSQGKASDAKAAQALVRQKKAADAANSCLDEILKALPLDEPPRTGGS